MNSFTHVPPGFRFHPTDEELVDYYLRKKVASKQIDLDVIKDVDLYKIEPWDLIELCRIGTEEQSEWYFFSHKDKKYPTGTRTNRATKAGFWKATGRDKAIYSKHSLIGMRKTLVFYKGRAPNGQKSDWIMHEYRLETNENGIPQEEGWVVCRVFKKRMPTIRKLGDYDSPCNWYDDQVSFMPELDSPTQITSQPYTALILHPHYPCKQELDHHLQFTIPTTQSHHHHHDPFLQLPQLESPKVPPQSGGHYALPAPPSSHTHEQQIQQCNQQNMANSSLYQTGGEQVVDQVTDWRVLDKFVASQLSHDQDHNNPNKEAGNYSNNEAFAHVAAPTTQVNGDDLENESRRQEEFRSTLASTCSIELWK